MLMKLYVQLKFLWLIIEVSQKLKLSRTSKNILITTTKCYFILLW